ncbi:MAG: CHAT domain-containing protein [Candidatus Omnitrophota bacterium]
MKRNRNWITFLLCFLTFILIGNSQNSKDKEKNVPGLAESVGQLRELIKSAINENNPKLVAQIKDNHRQLVQKNILSTIIECGKTLKEAIENELCNQKKMAKTNFQVSQIMAEIYKDAANSKYLLDKVALFYSWNKKEKENYREAEKLFFKGNEYFKNDKHNEALKIFEKLLPLYKELGYKEGQLKSIFMIGRSYIILSRYKEAQKKIEEGLDLSQKIIDPLNQANCLILLGEVHRMLNEYERAQQYLKKAINTCRDINYSLGQANALWNLGEMEMDLSDYGNARNEFEENLKISRKINDLTGESDSLRSLGDIHLYLAEYEKAQKRYEESLQISREIKDQLGEANTLHALGDLNKMISENERAVNLYEESLRVYREINNRIGEANCLLSLGETYLSMSDYEKSRRSYQEGLDVYRKIKIYRGEANCLQGFGKIYTHLSEYEKAERNLEEALTIYRKLGDRLGESDCLVSLGNFYFKYFDYEKARQKIELALSIQKQIGDRQDLPWSYYRLGQTLQILKNYPEAKENYINSVRVIEDAWQIMKLEEYKTRYLAEKIKPYEALIDFLFKSGEGTQAYSYAERSKARTFLYLLGNKRIDPRKGVPPELINEEEDLKKRIHSITIIRSPSESLKNQLLQLKKKYSEIIEKIKLNSPEYASLLNVNPLSTDELQSLIREDGNSVLIEYYTTSNSTYLWALDGKRVIPIQLKITEEELNTKIKKYHSMISNPIFGLDILKPRACELYDLLLKPLEKQLTGKSKIAIVPHGILHYLPFETLMDKKSRKFLIEKGIQSFYLPSASAYKFCKEKNQLKKENAVIFANPDGTLPASERETENIRQLFPQKIKIFEGKKANETSVKNDSKNADIVHFACHANFDSAHPLYSGLILAPDSKEDGRLEVQDIFQLELKPAYLVTLSACETNIGNISPGDEIVAMSRAFMYAGTPSVLASLWKVDDDYTEKLMTTFYRELKSKNKIDALQIARLEIINKYGKRHPYYWAPFILIGDYR